MKYKSLFALAAASLTMLFACQKPVDLGPEKVSIDSEATHEFPVEGGEYTVQLTATVDWTLQGYDETVQSWLSVTPSSGKASAEVQTITIKAMANDGANRQASLVFYGNIMQKAPLTITQKGPDGEGAVITIAEFIEKADTQNEYVLSGVIGDIATNAKYWGFTLKDDTGTISCPFIGANADEFLAMNMHTGDKVSIKGKYEFYADKQEHQLSDGVIVSHEAVALDAIQTVSVADFITAADPFTMYRLTGEVSSSVNAQYCSFDLKDESGTIVVWTVNNASEYASTLKQGDKVTLRGAYTLYDNGSSTKHEVVDATIESVEDGQGGGEEPDPSVEEPTSATKVTIEEFLGKPVSETDWYELTGTVVSIVPNNNYGNLTISDETGSVYVYGLVKAWAGGKNDQSFPQIGLEVGDIVTLWAVRDEYNGTAQAGSPAIYKSHEEGVPVTYPEGTAFLTFPDGNQTSVSSYTDTWEAICDGKTFTITNFNNNKNGWAYIKCGRKTEPSVASIANASALPKLSSVEVTVDNVTKASSINSVTLTVYSDAGNTVQVGEPIARTDFTAGVWAFAIPDGMQAENLYYKLTFDCAPHGSSNGIIQISKVTYIAAE